jgi:alpha-D-xyloside xylohydrolase
MGTFDVEAPHWGRIPAVAVTGAPVVNADGSVSLGTDAGLLRIAMLESGVRLRLGPDTRDYGILVREPATLAARVEAIDGGTRIAAGERVLDVGHVPLSFSFSVGDRRVQSSPSDAHFVRRFRLPPFARIGDAWFVSLELGHDSPVDALGVNAEVSYKNAPFAWSPEGWGVFVHTVAPVVHGVGYAPWSQRAYGLKVDEPALDLFLFDGTNGAQLLGQYTALTGRAPVPPLWSLGLILSKAYYRTADEILAVAREVRARGMPCDTITFDGRAWQDTDTRFAFEWDPTRYPDPQAVVAQLKALDFRVCVWEYPLVSVLNPLFGELAARGWLLKDARTGEAYRYQWDLEPFGKVLTPLPESGLVDFTNADAYAYWRDRHRELFELGVDMIKPDFGEQVEPHMVAFDGARGDALHNVYALLYNRCVHEAAGLYARDGGFLFSRSAWSGSQRYPSQWGGDPQADWGGLAASIRGGLSWGMTGAPYYATDVGGFYGDQRDPLLYVRWAQASVFSAHMRLHGIGAREPWSYGPEAERAAMAALELRYRLLPYLWRVVEQAAATGLPVQRAMVLACPDEPESWAFDHQFFCGDDLLVAPCLEPSGRVRVYLPEGDWCRFPRGDAYAGGRTQELVLALDELAVFARRGTEIPLGAAVQHTGAGGAVPPVVEVWRAA